VRIIAGKFRSLQLSTVPGMDVRPTMDRVRESLFSILSDHVSGALVLDLFSGSGALGLEALSRGALAAHFVESGRGVIPVLRKNIERLAGIDATIHPFPVEKALPRLAALKLKFDLVFLDPPYRRNLVPPVLERLIALGLPSSSGRIVAEHEVRFQPPREVGNWFRVDSRTYGDTALSIYSPLSGQEG
jgi:16S rRNA (guanine(966)-N(2))-methyltransferase RsmD